MKVTTVRKDDTGMVSIKHVGGEKFDFTKLARYVNVKTAKTGTRKILGWFQAKWTKLSQDQNLALGYQRDM
jgi:hypothetical protein